MSPEPVPPKRPPFLVALYHELKRRGVLHVAGAFVVASWIAIQASDILYAPLGLQKSPVKAVIVVALVGFPIAILSAWFFNVSRDRDETGSELTPAQSRIAMLGSLGFGVLVLLLGGWLALRPAGKVKLDDVRPAAFQANHVAVLYFTHRNKPAPEDEYLADALTETLIEQLAQQDSIVVISSNGVQQFRGTQVGLDSIAKSLNVGTIVSGSVWTTADSVHVLVNMIRQDGSIETTRAIVQKRGDTFALVDSAVFQVSDILRKRIGQVLEIERWRRETENDSAWALVRRADLLEKNARSMVTRGARQAAMSLLQDADSMAAAAERLDPAFSEATRKRAWIAWGKAFVAYKPGESEQGAVTAAIHEGYGHAARELVRHPGDPQALEVRGALASLELQLATPQDAEAVALQRQAEQDLRTAGKKDPGRARALSNLSNILYTRGDYEGAQSFAEQAQKADTYLEDKNVLHRLFFSAFERMDDETARAACAEQNRRHGGDIPAAFCTLYMLAWMPDVKPSVTQAEAARSRIDVPAPMRSFYEPHLDMLKASVMARAGMRDSARAVLNRAIDRKSPDPDLLLLEAGVRVALRETDDAKRLLDRYVTMKPALRAAILNSRRFRPQ